MKLLLISIVLIGGISTPALAGNDVKAGSDGITIEAGALEVNVGGRLHLDGAVFDDPASNRTGVTDAAVRRARIEVSGRIGKVVRFRVDREFAGGSSGWRNVWVSLEPVRNLELKGGNFKVPLAMEDLQSSNSMPFVERSLTSALTPDYGLGGMASASGNRWSFALGYFTDPLSHDESSGIERGHGLAGRATILPIKRDKFILHLGLGSERRTIEAAERVRFSANSGSTLAPSLMSSGTLRADGLRLWNGEVAASFGSIVIEGHTTFLTVKRSTAADLHFSGQAISATWLITGEKYDYSEHLGIFTGPKLKTGKRAVELALRYSRLDLDDDRIQKGVGRTLTGGVNWYLNRNLRLMADLTDAKVRFPGSTLRRHNRVGVARLQLAF